MRGRRKRERGFALLIVLWTMSLLALLAAQVTGGGRAETRTATALREGAEVEAAADGAVFETLWHLLDGSGETWPIGGPARWVAEPGARVLVQVLDDRGKLDINQVPPALLTALFAELGADQSTAQQVGNAISDWRTPGVGGPDQTVMAQYTADGRLWGPPGGEFQRLDELLLVRGMTPQLYAASLPYLTLALEQGPWLNGAAPVVLAAIARAHRDAGLATDDADARGPEVMHVIARAQSPSGAVFTRRAIIRLDGSLNGSAWKYRILNWESGSDPVVSSQSSVVGSLP